MMTPREAMSSPTMHLLAIRLKIPPQHLYGMFSWIDAMQEEIVGSDAFGECLETSVGPFPDAQFIADVCGYKNAEKLYSELRSAYVIRELANGGFEFVWPGQSNE